MPEGLRPRTRSPGHLEISLRSLAQLFESLDPAPFYERDLDVDAERFLVSWAQELPRDTELKLTLHLREWPQHGAEDGAVTRAIHSYFAERERMTKLERTRLLRRGRTSLAIGASFLLLSLVAADLLTPYSGRVLLSLLRESLYVAGWVGMWQPLQIFLYEWWPLRQQERLFARMSRMPVKLRHCPQPAVAAAA